MVRLVNMGGLPNVTGVGIPFVWSELVLMGFFRLKVKTVMVVLQGNVVTAIFTWSSGLQVGIDSFGVSNHQPSFMDFSSSKTITACGWWWRRRRRRSSFLFLGDVPNRPKAGSTWSWMVGTSRFLGLWTIAAWADAWHLKIREPVILSDSLCSQAVAISATAVVLSSPLPLPDFVDHVLCWSSIAFWEGVVRRAGAGGERAVGRVPFPSSELLHAVVWFGVWELTSGVWVWHML